MFGKTVKPDYDYEAFTLFDSKARIYREPMLALNQEDIIRQLQTLFTDPRQATNILTTNSEDFSLFRIGTFSKKTGSFDPINPEHLANLHELKPAKPPEWTVAELLSTLKGLDPSTPITRDGLGIVRT